MKERQILFSTPMVRAILDGSKTQTRRMVKPQPVTLPDFNRGGLSICVGGSRYQAFTPSCPPVTCPFGRAGDRLWVRETWCVGYADGCSGYSAIPWTGADERRDGKLFYRADLNEKPGEPCIPWRPSIHMPRWASRITLEVTGVRIERLNDIREKDAWAEGCEGYDDDVSGGMSGYREFCNLWESINGKGSWDANPWVWVVEFNRVQP